MTWGFREVHYDQYHKNENLLIAHKAGMVYGYLGTNGSGKTTTIRNLMGFLKPQQGTVQIKGKDAWKDRTELKYDIGYVAGQFEFPRLNQPCPMPC